MSLTVLLVEDSDTQAQLCIHQLRAAGENFYSVIHAPSVKRTIEILEEQGQSIDLILLDLMLEDCFDPIETLRRIIPYVVGIPVIVLTSIDDDHIATQLIGKGADDYLRKSEVTALNLVRTMRYTLERFRRNAGQSKTTGQEFDRIGAALEGMTQQMAQLGQKADQMERVRKSDKG